jgi:hypothetical protein
MIFMILAVALFFIIVALFYLAVTVGNIKKTAETSTRTGSILLLSQLAGSPEFNCPESSSACVDTDKLLALMNHPEYAKFWGVSGLFVERVYPVSSNSSICNSINYPRCTSYPIVTSKAASLVRDESYVNLCRREFQSGYPFVQCDLGKIIVETERKT